MHDYKFPDQLTLQQE